MSFPLPADVSGPPTCIILLYFTLWLILCSIFFFKYNILYYWSSVFSSAQPVAFIPFVRFATISFYIVKYSIDRTTAIVRMWITRCSYNTNRSSYYAMHEYLYIRLYTPETFSWGLGFLRYARRMQSHVQCDIIAIKTVFYYTDRYNIEFYKSFDIVFIFEFFDFTLDQHY